MAMRLSALLRTEVLAPFPERFRPGSERVAMAVVIGTAALKPKDP